jgi:oligoribonuclease NrnB/cAMP/cGMP phosphodiesterase (DHH superfamily)
MPAIKKASQKTGKKIAVIYHADCPDGFGAAYAAWKKFGSKADYYPLSYDDIAPALRGKTVYLLDFMFDNDGPLKVLQKANKQVTALDHHISNKARVMSTTDYRYARHTSGAVLAWQYFHPGKPVPLWLKYVEDYDIWPKRLPGVDEVNAYLLMQSRDFKTWDKLVRNFEKAAFRKEVIKQGAMLRKYEDLLVKKAISGAYPVKFMGYAVYAVNFNGTKTAANEINLLLYKKHPPFSILWRQRKDGIHISLRGNGTIDTSKFAQKFGGGGHRDSSAFRVDAKKGFPWKDISS